MSERNQGKNNEYDTGDLHTVCACGDDPASDPAFPVSEGRGRNFDARTENGHPSDTAYGSAAVAVKSYFHKVSESVFGSDSGIWGGIPKSTCEAMQAIADTVHKSMGFTKNCFDLFNICITITVGLVCQGHLIGIGLGTVVAGIGVGRVIAIFNHGFKKKWMIWQAWTHRSAGKRAERHRYNLNTI